MVKKVIASTLASLIFLSLCFFTFVWLTTERYSEIEPVKIRCDSNAPLLDLNRPLKVLSWNIQFLAGKNYVFFYDALDGSGSDEAPSREDIKATLKEVVRIIREENPDIVLLQEVDVDAKRTAHQDQVELLLKELNPLFPCSASTYYWRAGFVPHPNIMGSIGMKLATFSKFQLSKGMRHSLGEFPANIIVRQFRPKRAILDTTAPTLTGSQIRILNTHLEAYSQGSDLMEYQVKRTSEILSQLESSGTPWLVGGDFNLLMPGRSYQDLSAYQKPLYKDPSELKALTDQYASIPSLRDVNGDQRELWYTHFPNDHKIKGPDRTIDYIFYSQKLSPRMYRVRSRDTLNVSDHLPVIVDFNFSHR